MSVDFMWRSVAIVDTYPRSFVGVQASDVGDVARKAMRSELGIEKPRLAQLEPNWSM